MSADLAARVPLRTYRSPATVILSLTSRKAMRSGAIWGYLFGASIASSAISYTQIYRTTAERNALAAAYGANNATSALFGPAPRLETVAGFTAFKVSMTLMVLGAVWGLLTSTRLLRGEEDNQRWDLLLAGQTTRKRAAAQALGALGAGVLVLWAVTAAITVVVGLDSKVHIAAGPALFFALAMVATAVMFIGVGAFTSQLAATRRQAATYAAGLLAVSYAIRMIADAGVGLHGLSWVSPLGWVEELRPLTRARPLALLPIAAFTAVLAIVTLRLAATRDVGAGIRADHANAAPRLRLLSGHVALGFRLSRPAIVGWWAAIAVSGVLFGLVAMSAGSTISGSSVQEVFAKLGAAGTGTAAVLGVCFLIVGVLVASAAAGLVTATRSEESSGRLEALLARPVGRASWLGGRALLALLVVVAAGLAAGLGAWIGAASQHAPIGLATLLDAGVNLVPPAITIYGVGLLTFGLRPRWTSIVVNTVLGWSLLVVVIGSSVGAGGISHLVLDTSVFHQMASAPAVAPHWAANGVMTAVGVACVALAALAFRRRDLQGE